MDLFFASICMMEFTEHGRTDEIIKSISNVNGTPFNAFHIPMIEKCHPKYTYALLSWICLQSRGIPEFIESFFGMLATHFYATHKKDETMSLTWLKEVGGAGKILTAMQVFPYARAAMADGPDGKETLVYNLMEPEDLYICE